MLTVMYLGWAATSKQYSIDLLDSNDDLAILASIYQTKKDMISQREMEKRNLQSSILFMQQEHSDTLKALHEEISRLQKQCTDLNFKLTMQESSNSESNRLENETKIKDLQSLLSESLAKQNELQKEVTTKSEIIKDLKSQLKMSEHRYVDELKSKSQQVLALRVQLDNKSDAVATLTAEIHKLKVLQSHERDKPKTPPSRESSAKKRLSKRTSALAYEVYSRPLTAKTNIPAPDAEVFLANTAAPPVSGVDLSMRPTPPVLPPITGEDLKNLSRRQQLVRRRMEPRSPPEYATLAVDQLASNSSTYIHEPNTTK